MWVLTGERECFCGIHIIGKSIRIVDDAASRRRIEHLFDTLEACPHLTNFLCVALHGTAMHYASDKCNLADSIAELREMAAAATMCWPRPPASRPGRGAHGPSTHVGHELIAAGMLITAGGSNGTLDDGAGALDTGRLRGGL